MDESSKPAEGIGIVESGNTNWGKSVGVVVMRDGKVLLGRHTYGAGRGNLILPGGYLDEGETAERAAVREVAEETSVTCEVTRLVACRLNSKEFYLIFAADWVSGDARPGDEENSEVVWMDADDALSRDDVALLTQYAIRSAVEGHGIEPVPYVSKHNPNVKNTYYG